MAVNHASLTGASLHEPKGADTAELGQVYIADGNGSGSWTSIAETSFTGQIADFCTPVAPTGWLECDGSTINTTTYAALYAAMTIQQTGNRTNGSAIITGLSNTTHMRAGYYVFGTGIASGTTIVSVDSATQITLSGVASSSGTSTVAISPWLLNTGTITLPNLSGSGYFRRSRTSSNRIGAVQAGQNETHTHTFNGTTNVGGVDHTHSVNFSGNTGGIGASHTHGVIGTVNYTTKATQVGTAFGGDFLSWSGEASATSTNLNTNTSTQSNDHSHAFTVSTTSGGASGFSHNHTFGGTTTATGSSEARPINIAFMTCVKT